MIKTPVDEFTLSSSLTVFPPRELSPVIGGFNSANWAMNENPNPGGWRERRVHGSFLWGSARSLGKGREKPQLLLPAPGSYGMEGRGHRLPR